MVGHPPTGLVAIITTSHGHVLDIAEPRFGLIGTVDYGLQRCTQEIEHNTAEVDDEIR